MKPAKLPAVIERAEICSFDACTVGLVVYTSGIYGRPAALQVALASRRFEPCACMVSAVLHYASSDDWGS